MHERIHLLITSDSMPLGGAETLILQHLDDLDRSQFDVHFATLQDRGTLLPDAKASADHYLCLHRRAGLDVLAIWRLRRYIVSNKIDLVHTNLWLDALYVWLAAAGLGVRKIATVHGLRYTWRHMVRLWLARSFDRVICVSRFVQLDLYRVGLPWEKLVVVYNCYDVRRFCPVLPGRERAGDKTFRAIMVARFSYCRDQQTLVEAVRLLTDKGYDLELHLVGEGDSRRLETCRTLVAEMGLEHAVRFWGPKRVDGSFLSQFDLFVSSARCETFGIAVLEAMASGLPVLVSDTPALMELIQHGECGFYFETGNASDCADVMAHLIEAPDLRAALAQKAYERAQEFQARKIVRDLEQVYLEVGKVKQGRA